MKNTLKEIGIILGVVVILGYPFAQACYDNWVKWQVAKAAQKVVSK